MITVDSVLQVLQAIYDIKCQLEDNHAGCKRLCERCLSARPPLQELMKSSEKITSKQQALVDFWKVLDDAKNFTSAYAERTYWRSFTKVLSRNSFSKSLALLHKRFDECLGHLELGLIVDTEQRRREDLEDTRKIFNAAVHMILEKISVQGDKAQESLTELKHAIADNQTCIEYMLAKCGHAALTPVEQQTIRDENEYLHQLTISKLNEVLHAIRDMKAGQLGLEAGQNYTIDLIKKLSLNNDENIMRESKLRQLQRSFTDIKQGTLPIAGGAFGEVFVGYYHKKNQVALKVLRNKDDQALTENEIRAAQSEVLLLDYLTYPGIVTCYGFVPDAKQLVIVLELAPFGSLWDIVSNATQFPALPFTLSLAWLEDLADVLKYIHSKGVVHKDIKCENLLLFEGLQLKLCDFGLSKHSFFHQTSIAGAGTGAYRAPEVRNALPATPASDLLSLAMTALQLYSRKTPVYDDVAGQINSAFDIVAMRPRIDAEIVRDLRRLTLRAASVDPIGRPSSAEVADELGGLVERCGDPRKSAHHRDEPVTTQVKVAAHQFSESRWNTKSQYATVPGNRKGKTVGKGPAAAAKQKQQRQPGPDPELLLKLAERKEKVDEKEREKTVDEGCPPVAGVVTETAHDAVTTVMVVNSAHQPLLSTPPPVATTSSPPPAAGSPSKETAHHSRNVSLMTDVYEGSVKNVHGKDIPHGEGKMTEICGNIYEGEWKDGEKCGEGIMVYTSGDMYQGQWKNNKMHGHGTFMWYCDGVEGRDSYIGEWKDGKQHGQGVCKWTGGFTYTGEWIDGMRSGSGRQEKEGPDGITVYDGHWMCTLVSGDVYTGKWMSDEKHGKGILLLSTSGEMYDGKWQNNQKCGPGVYKYANGAVYDGLWEDNKRHGKGKYTTRDGIVFEINWEKDMPDNNGGKITNPDGSVYQGDVTNWMKSGVGAMTFVNGDVYNGEWEDDRKHGHGEYKWLNGQVYEGEWKHGKKHGKGVMKYANRTVYDGAWENDKFHGEGKFTWVNGDFYKGYWTENKKDGKGILEYKDGSFYGGDWKDEKRHGHGVMKYTNGDVYTGQWEDDKRHGTGMLQSHDGTLLYNGDWKSDVKHGVGVMKRKSLPATLLRGFVPKWKDNDDDGDDNHPTTTKPTNRTKRNSCAK